MDKTLSHLVDKMFADVVEWMCRFSTCGVRTASSQILLRGVVTTFGEFAVNGHEVMQAETMTADGRRYTAAEVAAADAVVVVRQDDHTEKLIEFVEVAPNRAEVRVAEQVDLGELHLTCFTRVHDACTALAQRDGRVQHAYP